jgi:hypothetical protein
MSTLAFNLETFCYIVMYVVRAGLVVYVVQQFARQDCVYGFTLVKCNYAVFFVYWEMLFSFLVLYRNYVIL